MKRKRLSNEIIYGVYKIENSINKKVYIGSSIDIYNRWVQHENELNKNKHHSSHLQYSWNKYGKESFDFSILEICELKNKDNLFELEQKWMDFYKSYNENYGYNMIDNAICPTAEPASYDGLVSGKFNITWDQFFRVVYYLLCTEYEIPKISEITRVQYRTVYQIYFHENYKNLTKGLNFIKRKKFINNKLSEEDVREIVKLLLKNDFSRDIAKLFGVGSSTIDDIRNHKTWTEITQDIIFDNISKRKRPPMKSVSQYDLDNNYITTYESAHEAERQTGIGFRMISRVCNGGRPYTHGYIFKFTN